MRDRKLIRSVLTFAGALVLAADVCAMEGVVAEEGTNRPIGGAFVVATWLGQKSLVVESRTACYHIVFARTDEKGHFSIPDYTGNLNPTLTERRRQVSAYAPGYQMSFGGDDDPKALRMVKRSGSPGEQFSKVRPASTSQCTGTTDKRLLPMFKAVRDELRSLASTKEQRRKVLDWDSAVDLIELSENEAIAREGKRLSEFYRKEGPSN